MANKYRFIGFVNPRNFLITKNWNWSLITTTINEHLYELKVKIDIVKSKITIETETDDPIDVHGQRDLISGFISFELDCYGFVNGLWVEAEINEVYDYAKGKTFQIGPFTSGLKNWKQKTSFKDPEILAQIIQEKKYSALRNALKDSRLGLKNIPDTGFFCFRAIESIREYFVDQDTDNSRNTKPSWIRMNKALNLTKDYSTDVSKFATGPRHGNPKVPSGTERNEILEKTWNIIERFIIYVQQRESQLDETEYPQL